jgi:hypothetical protein
VKDLSDDGPVVEFEAAGVTLKMEKVSFTG